MTIHIKYDELVKNRDATKIKLIIDSIINLIIPIITYPLLNF